MRFGIYGKKVGMTQIFDEKGLAIPITVVDTTDCFVSQVKTKENDGYSAVQVAFGARKPQNISKPAGGLFKKAGFAGKATIREIRFEESDVIPPLKPGQTLSASMFLKGDMVDVSGVSKGHGFTGVFKRHNFHGKDETHGTSKYFRHGGSIGTNTWPGRVMKNIGMPGQDGNQNVTVQNIQVIEVRAEENLLLLKGAIPGPKNGILLIRSATRKKAPEGRNWTGASSEAEAPAAAENA